MTSFLAAKFPREGSRRLKAASWLPPHLNYCWPSMAYFMGKAKIGPGIMRDDTSVYTPAWQEKFTGVSASLVISFARQWAQTAAKTEGKCSVIIGAGLTIGIIII